MKRYPKKTRKSYSCEHKSKELNLKKGNMRGRKSNECEELDRNNVKRKRQEDKIRDHRKSKEVDF